MLTLTPETDDDSNKHKDTKKEHSSLITRPTDQVISIVWDSFTNKLLDWMDDGERNISINEKRSSWKIGANSKLHRASDSRPSSPNSDRMAHWSRDGRALSKVQKNSRKFFKKFRTTFYLAISILDRYLHQATSVQRCHLQTIGTAALLLAAKLEEVVPPDIFKLVDFGDGAVEITHLVKVVRL